MTDLFFTVLKQTRVVSYGLGVGVIFLLIFSPAKRSLNITKTEIMGL